MVSLSGTMREAGTKIRAQRREGVIPAVLYGPKTDPTPVGIALKQFSAVYEAAGESTLVELELDGKNRLVLIHDIQRDPVSGDPIHVDFYEPALDKTVEVGVELVFEGEAPAVKDHGGTLLVAMDEVQVEALPQKLPHDIRVSVAGLKTFEDRITIADLPALEGVTYLHEQDEVIAHVDPAEDIDAQLEKPVEENVEAVEQAGKEKKEKGTEGEDEENGE